MALLAREFSCYRLPPFTQLAAFAKSGRMLVTDLEKAYFFLRSQASPIFGRSPGLRLRSKSGEDCTGFFALLSARSALGRVVLISWSVLLCGTCGMRATI